MKKQIDFSKPMYPIGIVAERIGVSSQMIRVYEKRGLIKSQKLYKNNVRFYPEEEIRKLQKTRSMRKKKLSLENIKGILRK